jgi:hypothetical protein
MAEFAHCDPLGWKMGVTMRGDDGILRQPFQLEKRVRADHPLQVIEANSAVCRNSQFTGRDRRQPQTMRAGRLLLSPKQDPPHSARDRSRAPLHQYRSMAVILIPRATTSQLRRRWLRRKD